MVLKIALFIFIFLRNIESMGHTDAYVSFQCWTIIWINADLL